MRIILGLNEYYRIYDDFSQVFRAPYLGPALAYYHNELTMGALNDTLTTLLIQDIGLVQPKYIIQDSLRQNIIDFPGHPINASGPLTVEGLAPGALLELYAPDGRRLSRVRALGETMQWPVEGLAPGLYVLKIGSGAFRTVKKVVVKGY